MRRIVRPKTGLALVAVLLGGSVGVGAAAGGEVAPQAVVEFSNDMTGTQEVPPADLDGAGTATVRLNTTTGRVCFTVKFTSTGTPNRGHIHIGPAGTNGGISIALFELVGLPADVRNDALENQRLTDCVTADPALVEMIANDPTGHYVNLHNARFPGGALRCQLSDA